MVIGYNLEGDLRCLNCVQDFINDAFEGKESDFLDYVEVHGYAIDNADIDDNENMKGFGHIKCHACGKTIK